MIPWWTGTHVIMMRIVVFIHKINISLSICIYFFNIIYTDCTRMYQVQCFLLTFQNTHVWHLPDLPVHTFRIQAALKPSAACAPRSFSTSAPNTNKCPLYIFAKVMDHLFLTTLFQRNSGFSLLLCCLIVIPSPKLV